MRSIAIIPARGGSKRIPRKNLKLFLGKPVLGYSIEAALSSELFSEVMVSTEDEEIADVARQYGASVPFLRTDKLADDYSTTDDVISWVLSKYKAQGQEFDVVCCLYATAPLVRVIHLRAAYEMVVEGRCGGVYPVVAYSSPIQRSLVIRDGCLQMRWAEYARHRSQDLEPHYHDAGQFYIASTNYFLQPGGFDGDNTYALVLSEMEVQDLDTLEDWALAELKYQLLTGNHRVAGGHIE